MTAPRPEPHVAFVDTETTGLNPELHPIWEWAVIVDGYEHVWQTKLTNAQLGVADPYALNLNGFHERYNLDGSALTPRQSIDRFVEAVTGRHIVGAIPSFDEERIRRLYVAEYGWPTGKFPWHYHIIDIEAMAVGFLNCLPNVSADYRRAEHRALRELPWKSDDLGRALGVTPTPAIDRHTAIGDARWVRRMWGAMQR